MLSRNLNSMILICLLMMTLFQKQAKVALPTDKVSAPKLKAFKELFALFDVNQNGEITVEELKAGIVRYAAPEEQVSEDETLAKWKKFDRDNTGTIDFDEFVEVMKQEAPEKLKQVFKKYDEDDDGGLNLDELRKLINEMRKYQTPEDELLNAFRMADENKDEKIEFNEFISLMKYL